jgi:hypothetical protein
LTDFESEAQKIKQQLAYLNGQQDVIRMFAASANSNPVNKPKSSNTTKQYNLVKLLTNSGPIMPDDVSPAPDGLKYYGGSTNQQPDKSASEKRRKSYELFRMIAGAMG